MYLHIGFYACLSLSGISYNSYANLREIMTDKTEILRSFFACGWATAVSWLSRGYQ